MGGKTSTASKAQYTAKAYDEIKVRVRKGDKDEIKVRGDKGDKDSIRAFAQSQGKTVNRFICDLIQKKKKKEAGT